MVEELLAARGIIVSHEIGGSGARFGGQSHEYELYLRSRGHRSQPKRPV
jgi:hypothetical protein